MTRVEQRGGTDRAGALAARLEEAAAGLVTAIDAMDDGRWRLVPEPGEWSISKDAEHVAEALAYHQWIVRLTIGQDVPSRWPALERSKMTSHLSQSEAVELIRRRVEDCVRLLLDLTDSQLNLPTRPPRASAPLLADAIDRVLIGHLQTHLAAIEAKVEGTVHGMADAGAGTHG